MSIPSSSITRNEVVGVGGSARRVGFRMSATATVTVTVTAVIVGRVATMGGRLWPGGLALTGSGVRTVAGLAGGSWSRRELHSSLGSSPFSLVIRSFVVSHGSMSASTWRLGLGLLLHGRRPG